MNDQTSRPKGWIEPARRPYRPGVGVVLINREGRVFAGRRHDRFPDAWQMPQGGIDPGEAPLEAALRELEEETGVAPRLVEILAEDRLWRRYDLPESLMDSAWGGRFRGQEQKWFAARFLGSDADIDIETAHQEFVAWRWARVDELLVTIVEFKRPLYRAVFAEFAPHLAPWRG
jgi:putative (di)nucleoside polyphosphate hydrolase